MSFHKDRKYLGLQEGQSTTYFVVSIPKEQVKFSLMLLSESKERFYYVYSPSIKDKLTPDTQYYKQIFTRKDNKLIMDAITSSLSEFENMVKFN